MQLAKAALQSRGNGLRDSALIPPVADAAAASFSSSLPIPLTPLTSTELEEPITLLLAVSDGDSPLVRSRGAVLRGGEVRPYSAEEVRATSGTEFASGKALHTFVGHYRLVMDGEGVPHIKEGPGALYTADGGFFLGHWSNNQRHGPSALYSATGYGYEGEFSEDQPHGYGMEMQPNGDVYVGDFADGRPHGRGVVYYRRNGSSYVGDFSRGEKHGRGVVLYDNGDVFEGHWVGGRRSGTGVTYSAAERVSLASHWHRDRCPLEGPMPVSADVATWRRRFIDANAFVPFDELDSPFGSGVSTFVVAHELVREIPALLRRRLERCFDRLDASFTGEVPLLVLEAALESHADGKDILRAMARAAEGANAVPFWVFLHGFFPHLAAAELQRCVQREWTLETLLRVRGALAGVLSARRDGFSQLAAGLDAAQGLVGGVRVPRGALCRARALGAAERVGFVELMERLYPSAPLPAIRRCEVASLPPPIFHAHAAAFAALADAKTGGLAVDALVSAKRRFAAARARGWGGIERPSNGLERRICAGRQRGLAHWDVAGIELSVTFARYADRARCGHITLADVLRHAYPNIPCLVTRQRLLACGGTVANGNAECGHAGTEESATCSCCICMMCAANGLPLGGAGKNT